MADYKEISRRGLIKLNTDFDIDNDGQLKEYLNHSVANGRTYEEVRPYEQIVERLDDVTEALEGRVDAVSESMLERANKVFDSLIDAISGEVKRCENVLQEQEDDDAFSDEMSDDDDDDLDEEEL